MREIQLTQGKVALVDDEDYADLNAHRWHVIRVKGKWYAVRLVPRNDGRLTSCMMGRAILDAPRHLVVDYKNNDGLDNRRDNIRLATRAQDSANAVTRKHSRTGLKGVKPVGKRFRARITVKGRVINIGTFATAEEAHAAYCDASKKYHGEFGRTR